MTRDLGLAGAPAVAQYYGAVGLEALIRVERHYSSACGVRGAGEDALKKFRHYLECSTSGTPQCESGDIFTGGRGMRSMDEVADQTAVRSAWLVYFQAWYAAYYLLGTTSIVLSTLVASQPFPTENDTPYKIMAWLLALSTALFTFLKPGERADRYRRAWSTLGMALTRYRSNTASINDVLTAFEQGEAIIHEVAPPPNPPSTRPENSKNTTDTKQAAEKK